MSEEEPEPVTEAEMVAALLREREGYVVRGLPERVAAVDAELRRRGVEPPADERPPKRETSAVPRARRAPGKSET